MRRQNWLQRNQAAHIINLLAESMNGGKKTQGNVPQHRGARAPLQGKRVSGGDLLNMMKTRVM
jgi:hypothetical protein